MANAIRRVSCEAGHDPRRLALIAYGGNGPVHAGEHGRGARHRAVLVPKAAPAFSALGCSCRRLRRRPPALLRRALGRAEPGRINALLGELEEQALRELAQAGLRAGDVEFKRLLAVCYPGQTFDLAVPAVLDPDARMGAAELRATIAAFHDLHEETHSYAARDEEPIVRAVRVQALGRTPKPPARPLPRATHAVADARKGRRPAWFDGRFVDTPVYDGDRVGHGHRLEGPAIVEERFTTIVLYPGHVAELDAHGNYVVSLPT